MAAECGNATCPDCVAVLAEVERWSSLLRENVDLRLENLARRLLDESLFNRRLMVALIVASPDSEALVRRLVDLMPVADSARLLNIWASVVAGDEQDPPGGAAS